MNGVINNNSNSGAGFSADAMAAFAAMKPDAKLDEKIARVMDPGEMPADVAARLERTYESLPKIPQASVRKHGRKVKKSAVVISVAAACALLAGVAYAAPGLLQMNSGGGSFFTSEKNLPVFDSMEPGAKALSAQVGQTASIDGIDVTLDEVSCDRNVANLYLTLQKPGGFDTDELATYEGSGEGEWSRLQNALPIFEYSLTDSDGEATTGDVRRLDAYMEGGDIKCMMRIVPESTMGTQVQMDIRAWEDGVSEAELAYSFGLDLENIPEPKELGQQSLIFNTSQGDKHLNMKRFTSSELACVMVADSQISEWTDGNGDDVAGLPQDAMNPAMLKIADNLGNILYAVEPGDGNGIDENGASIIEYAGISPEATSVTFTPILEDTEAMEADRAARAQQIAATGQIADDGSITVDVSQSGAKIPLTQLGGYEISGWSVEGSTVTISMRPYGWVGAMDVPELTPEANVSMLTEQWSDPETGESGVGAHSAIRYVKHDYSSGEIVQIDSYYKATQEELAAVHNYRAHVYPNNWYIADEQASKTFGL